MRKTKEASANVTAQIAGFLALMLVATGFTWALGLSDMHYDSEGGIAFQNGFPGEQNLWLRHGEPANIHIDNSGVLLSRDVDAKSYAKWLIDLPSRTGNAELAKRLRITGKLQTIEQDQSDNSSASLMIWYLETPDAKPMLYQTVAVPDNSKAGIELDIETILSIPESASAAFLAFINRQSTGRYLLSDVQIDLVTTNARYKQLIVALVGLWLLLLGALLLWYWHRVGPWFGLTLLAVLASIVTGVLLPESFTTGPMASIWAKMTSALPGDSEQLLKITFKAGHFLFFFLAALLLLAKRISLGVNGLTIVVFFILLAVATEGMQLHLYNRSTRLTDLAIDLSGVLLAGAVIFVFCKLRTGNTTADFRENV
ncbi:MAG: VanZ family protein [Granulosicoccus sp.]